MEKFERAIQKYLKYNNNEKGHEENPHVIVLSGLPGSGKTTISKELYKNFNYALISNDKARMYLKNEAKLSDNWQDIKPLIEELKWLQLERCLKNQKNVVLDSNFQNNWQEKLKILETYTKNYYIVQIKCPINIIQERINKRSEQKYPTKFLKGSDLENYGLGQLDEYTLNLEPIPNNLIFFTIETDKDIYPQVEKLREKITNNPKHFLL